MLRLLTATCTLLLATSASTPLHRQAGGLPQTDVVADSGARARASTSLAYCPGPPGRLSALTVFHSKSFLYGAFVWARRALTSPKRRFPARAVVVVAAADASPAELFAAAELSHILGNLTDDTWQPGGRAGAPLRRTTDLSDASPNRLVVGHAAVAQNLGVARSA